MTQLLLLRRLVVPYFILGLVLVSCCDRAGSSGVVMLASQARGRGFKSRPVH
jgi:hypothetical protein